MGRRIKSRRFDEDSEDESMQPQTHDEAGASHVAQLKHEAKSVREAALHAFDELNVRHGLPVTRPQWHCWMEKNEEEFRGLMKSASALRQSRSHRIRARDGLPEAVHRIHVQRAVTQPVKAWAKLLWLRNGWHGIRSRTEGGFVWRW